MKNIKAQNEKRIFVSIVYTCDSNPATFILASISRTTRLIANAAN